MMPVRCPNGPRRSYRNHENAEVAEDPGLLLAEAGLVRDDQLLLAREACAQVGGTLGEHLVLAGFVDDDALTDFYATKLVIPRVPEVDLANIPPEVLRRIPADMAAEFRVVPVSSEGENNLTLAMSDPADRRVASEVAFFTGAYVERAVATQLQIAWCLAHYYGVVTPLARVRLGGGDEAAGRAEMPRVVPGAPSPVEDEEQTGPARRPPGRRKRGRRRSSELAPRSGILDVRARPAEPKRLPAVVVDEDELRRDSIEADVENDLRDTDPGDEESTAERHVATEKPVAREERRRRRRGSRMPTGSGEILLLERVKAPESHLSPHIEKGFGELGEVDSRASARQDTEVPRAPSGAGDRGESDTVNRQSKADRRRWTGRGHRADPHHSGNPATERKRRPSAVPSSGGLVEGRAADGPGRMSEEPAQKPSRAPDEGEAEAGRRGAGGLRSRNVGDLHEDFGGIGNAADGACSRFSDRSDASTEPMRYMNGVTNGKSTSRSGAGARMAPKEPAAPSVDEGWDVDDGWGPAGSSAGSTVPSSYMGAQSAAPEPTRDVPAPPGRRAATAPPPAASPRFDVPAAPPPAIEVDPAALAAEMERSSNRLLETLRALERAPGRDEVIDILLDHLAASHRRRAFFAVKGGVLFPFRQQGASIPGTGVAELSLERPSTFGHAAQGRIPYRGTLTPDALQFVERALGGPPGRGEIVVVPVAVRGRAVGLIYGDGTTGPLFDEHQAVLGRAAGQALERILATRSLKS